MGGSLDPTPATRLMRVLRPDWARTVVARRCTAAGLVVLAGVAALRPDGADDRAEVVVAARDLTPGAVLGDDDLRVETRVAATVPDGSQTDVAALAGSTLAAATRRGEVLTDVRLLGARLAESAAGPDARIVPVRPADPEVVDLLRAGDVVDVVALAAADPGAVTGPAPHATVVATDAVVVLVSPRSAEPAGNQRAVLVALPRGAANAVAGATLAQRMTFTLR